ncbi:MAG: hypothetical protein AAF841_04665 [Pseudomonadota bacterium]
MTPCKSTVSATRINSAPMSGDVAGALYALKLLTLDAVTDMTAVATGSTCPKGHICVGRVAVTKPPSVISFLSFVGGVETITFIVTQEGTLYGECIAPPKPEEKAKLDEIEKTVAKREQEKLERAPNPCGAKDDPAGKRIEACNLADLMIKASQLPDLPKDPKGPCRLYRDRSDNDRVVCAGKCKDGKDCLSTPVQDIEKSLTEPDKYVLECRCK